jgi:hypothetical protein
MNFLQEINVHRSIGNHPNVIRFIGMCTRGPGRIGGKNWEYEPLTKIQVGKRVHPTSKILRTPRGFEPRPIHSVYSRLSGRPIPDSRGSSFARHILVRTGPPQLSYKNKFDVNMS